MTPLLEIDGLGKSFGGLRAIDQLNFVVHEREILGLIGPNGAGKSTLFNLINGVFAPDQGSIRFGGVVITGAPPHRIAKYGIARAHQIVQPLEAMTVLENCTVGACFGSRNLSRKQAETVAYDAATFVGLDDRIAIPAAHLNIAGKKRLELARALAAQARLLLLDEVLAGLNPTEVDHMIGVVRRIRERGIAILMIEHLMRAIMSLSDRVVVLNSGKKLVEGPPVQVANDPQVIEAYLGDPELARQLHGGA